jgi:hypothetical protein
MGIMGSFLVSNFSLEAVKGDSKKSALSYQPLALAEPKS